MSKMVLPNQSVFWTPDDPPPPSSNTPSLLRPSHQCIQSRSKVERHKYDKWLLNCSQIPYRSAKMMKVAMKIMKIMKGTMVHLLPTLFPLKFPLLSVLCPRRLTLQCNVLIFLPLNYLMKDPLYLKLWCLNPMSLFRTSTLHLPYSQNRWNKITWWRHKSPPPSLSLVPRTPPEVPRKTWLFWRKLSWSAECSGFPSQLMAMWGGGGECYGFISVQGSVESFRGFIEKFCLFSNQSEAPRRVIIVTRNGIISYRYACLWKRITPLDWRAEEEETKPPCMAHSSGWWLSHILSWWVGISSEIILSKFNSASFSSCTFSNSQ